MIQSQTNGKNQEPINSGFIQLHRKITEWEWYTDTNTFIVFLHCIFKSNWKDKVWRGSKIHRGSFITSINNLAEETNLTPRKIRTALDKLKSTGELTIKATNKFTLVTVVNYDLYQNTDSKTTNKMTNERQTNDKQTTTTNKDNNINNYNKDTKVSKKENIPFENFYSKYPVKKSKVLAENKWQSLPIETQNKCIKVINGLEFKNWVSEQDIKYIKHPSTWLNQGCWDDELGTNTKENVSDILKNII